MRLIRLAFVTILALILIAVALANRQLITISLLPADLASYLGGSWSLTLPAFLALFLAILFGVLVGFIWEWLREASLRAEAKRRAAHVAQLEHEVAALRRTHAAPKDDVLAILEQPRNPATTGGAPADARPALPARG